MDTRTVRHLWATRPAIQFDGQMSEDIKSWLGPAFDTWLPYKKQIAFLGADGDVQQAGSGDWIVKGPSGFTALRPDEFASNYVELTGVC